MCTCSSAHVVQCLFAQTSEEWFEKAQGELDQELRIESRHWWQFNSVLIHYIIFIRLEMDSCGICNDLRDSLGMFLGHLKRDLPPESGSPRHSVLDSWHVEPQHGVVEAGAVFKITHILRKSNKHTQTITNHDLIQISVQKWDTWHKMPRLWVRSNFGEKPGAVRICHGALARKRCRPVGSFYVMYHEKHEEQPKKQQSSTYQIGFFVVEMVVEHGWTWMNMVKICQKMRTRHPALRLNNWLISARWPRFGHGHFRAESSGRLACQAWQVSWWSRLTLS